MRDQRLQIRLSQSEFTAIRQNAIASGYDNISQFVRNIASQNGGNDVNKKPS